VTSGLPIPAEVSRGSLSDILVARTGRSHFTMRRLFDSSSWYSS
jgi:hypothetical protein